MNFISCWCLLFSTSMLLNGDGGSDRVSTWSKLDNHTYKHYLQKYLPMYCIILPESFAGGNFCELDEVEHFANKTFVDC